MTSFEKIMTQEEKDLLIKDLCARLPYGVKAQVKYPINTNGECIITTKEITSVNCSLDIVQAENIDIIVGYYIFEVKPYLFPLSSMTEEQRKEYESLCIKNTSECTDLYSIVFPKDYYDTVESIDYLYKNHIDIRGFIPMGLAIDATNKNIY